MKWFKDDRVLIVGECGINHDGSLDQALRLIDLCADSGCDVAKFQIFKAREMYPRDAGQYRIAKGGTVDIYKTVESMETPEEWIPILMRHSKERDLGFLMTPGDMESMEVYLKYNPEILKVSSYEISHLELFKAAGATNLPFIFSTASSCLGDIEEALASHGGSGEVCVMHCNGKYPTDPEMVNMNVLRTLKLAFPSTVLGFSDHTTDPIEAPVAAVALGARVVEKHITLNKNLPGPDHSFAVDPEELKRMVTAIRETENKVRIGEKVDISPRVLGETVKKTQTKEEYLRRFAFRSIFSRMAISEGEVFSRENLAILRGGEKGTGLHPRYLEALLGKRAPVNIGCGEAITLDRLLS